MNWRKIVIGFILFAMLFSTLEVEYAKTISEREITMGRNGDVVIGPNYIRNNKLYIAWDTTTAYGYNNNPKGVITVWKVDDNGNGDPTDDENRIRGDLTGVEIGLQVFVGKYGAWGKWQRALGDKYPAHITTYMKGENGVVEIKCNWTEYNFELILKYTVKPNDSNLYAEVSYKVYGPTDINFIRYSYAQIASIWVTTEPGEMAWFDYYKLSGQPEHAISELPSADNKLHADIKKPLYGALRVSSKNWIQGLIPLNLSKVQDFYLRIKTGGSYNGWAFNRDIYCVIHNKTTLTPGTKVSVSFIWYAGYTNSYSEIEKIASTMQTGGEKKSSQKSGNLSLPWLWIVMGAVITAVVISVAVILTKRKKAPERYAQYPQQLGGYAQQPSQPPQTEYPQAPPPPWQPLQPSSPPQQPQQLSTKQPPSQQQLQSQMITVTCPYCGATYQLPANMRGQRIKCNNCGNNFYVQ